MDLRLVETGNGGDLQLKGNDLDVIDGFQNMPYMGMFGGNVAASTKARVVNEQAFDWWGNSLGMPDNESLQLNSILERTLTRVALTSSGRSIIDQAVKEDLKFMNVFAEVTITTAIISTDHIRISILIKQPDNLEDKEFIYIWDSTKNELTDVVGGSIIVNRGDFYEDDFNGEDFF